MEVLNLTPAKKLDSNKFQDAYEVIEDLETSYQGMVVRVPKFFQYDGASIPSVAWQIIGTPFNPRFMKAAVFHDWVYHTHKPFDRDTADKLFKELLLKDGVDSGRAKLMHKAVSTFGGWYWKNDKDDKDYIARLKVRIINDGRIPSDYGI